MRWQGSREDRPGWAKAPPVVEAEIRAVWQEDELPDEITKAPGFRPFTLGLDAQEWVDSMAEIVDGGKAVYGRPQPVLPIQHRQLGTSPPAFSQSPVVRPSTVPPPRYSPAPPPKPRVLMPDIDGAPPTPQQRPQMPDIAGSPPSSQPRVHLPDISESPSSPQRRVQMPDIDGTPTPRPRTLPKRVLMPDIGEEQQPAKPKPPIMPEIG